MHLTICLGAGQGHRGDGQQEFRTAEEARADNKRSRNMPEEVDGSQDSFYTHPTGLILIRSYRFNFMGPGFDFDSISIR